MPVADLGNHQLPGGSARTLPKQIGHTSLPRFDKPIGLSVAEMVQPRDSA